MTLTEQKMLAEFKRMAPEKTIKLHIDLLKDLLPVFLDVVENDAVFQRLVQVLDFSAETGRRWLRGDITDPMEVLLPLEGPGSKRLANRELDHENSAHFGDISLLVILAQNAIFYAADIQFDRVSDPDKPQSLDYEVTNEELAELLAERLGGASPRMVQRFEALWNGKVSQI